MNYIDYHHAMSDAKDIDPANDCLRYVCDRFELNIEQRYWVAFLYAMCYCAPTTFYMYNEFPDFENVDVQRLQRWWNRNKKYTLFQTDRLRVKSNDQFVAGFESYRKLLDGLPQALKFFALQNYDACFADFYRVFTFGRFTLYLYLEMVNTLTGFPLEPTESLDTSVTGMNLDEIRMSVRSHRNLWNIETTICAYRKYLKSQRYVGYYIERMRHEIMKLQGWHRGVDWDVIWQFRGETYDRKYLKE